MPLLLSVLQLSVAAQLSTAPLSSATLVARARAARYQQDSALAEYQATVRQRMSAGLGVARGLGFGIGAIARDRLAARFESVARVGWHAQLGAWGELLAARGVAPIDGEIEASPSNDDIALTLPYYPGRDRLWPMTELGDAIPTARHWIEHPLDAGADSVYNLSLGDSLTIRLPSGDAVHLRELRVRPRRPDPRLMVGSLWVDVASGALVRAAYRPSMPVDLWPFMEREIVARDDRDKVKKFGPYQGIIREVIVEHGLYEGRFWLPRVRIVEGEGTAKGAHVSMSIEQSFTYQRVRAYGPTEARTATVEPVDIDPRTGRVRQPTWHGVQMRTRRCRPRGDSTSAEFSGDSLLRDPRLTIMSAEGVRFRVLVPCNVEDLATSPLLPPSIYASGEQLFTDTDLRVLRKDAEQALDMSSQAEWNPRPQTVSVGFERGLVRYNRVEGLSAGVYVERVLGAGYTGGFTARLGTGDLQPNAELTITRSNLRNDVQFTAYRRLAFANDWGNPMGLGSSVVALAFGRDEGLYYRTLGAELIGRRQNSVESMSATWRLFAERHDSATVETQWSLARVVNGTRFLPNIGAREGVFAGGALGLAFASGTDPAKARLSSTVQLEAAGGETAYGRAAFETNLAQGLGGNTLATLHGAAGYAAGDLPMQRLWYLGGPYTVHGYAAGALAGDAFWMGRAELTKGSPMFRPVIFADIGWAGPRAEFTRPARTLAGAGVGFAALDGLFRLDLSAPLEGARRLRLDLAVALR